MTSDENGSALTPAADYQTARMATVPKVYKAALERLACELALGMEEPDVIFASYGYSEEQALTLMASTAFSVTMAQVGKEVRESGLSFKMKARAQAEELLGHSFEMATDPLAPHTVRAEIIKWTAKMAGYEPKDDKDGGKVGGGLSLSITFAGQEPMKVVAQEPATITQEN